MENFFEEFKKILNFRIFESPLKKLIYLDISRNRYEFYLSKNPIYQNEFWFFERFRNSSPHLRFNISIYLNNGKVSNSAFHESFFHKISMLKYTENTFNIYITLIQFEFNISSSPERIELARFAYIGNKILFFFFFYKYNKCLHYLILYDVSIKRSIYQFYKEQLNQY